MLSHLTAQATPQLQTCLGSRHPEGQDPALKASPLSSHPPALATLPTSSQTQRCPQGAEVLQAPLPQQSARLGGRPLRLQGPPGLIHLRSPVQKLDNENTQGAQRMLESAHLQDGPTPSLILRRSVRTPQCGRAKNYSLRAHQGGTWRLSLSRVLILKLGQNSPLL